MAWGVARSELNAVLTQRIEVAPGLVIMRVAPDGWTYPPFQPGQFTGARPRPGPTRLLSDPEPPPEDPDRLIRRAYSIASSSLERGQLELFVTLVRSGELTPRLFALAPGDRLWLGPKPAGMFTLRDVPPGRRRRHRHRHRARAVHEHAPDRARLQQTAAHRGARRRAALLGPRLLRRAHHDGAALPELHLPADRQPSRRRARAVGRREVRAGALDGRRARARVELTPDGGGHARLPLREPAWSTT